MILISNLNTEKQIEIMRDTVYVAYVTSGREKYDYHTRIVGVFEREHLAARAMFDYLCQTYRIFDGREEDRDLRDEYMDAKNIMHHSTDIDECGTYLQNCVAIYNDSSHLDHNDGWDYHIVRQDVKSRYVSPPAESTESMGSEYELERDSDIDLRIYPPPPPPPTPKTGVINDLTGEMMLKNVNAVRASIGMPPLVETI